MICHILIAPLVLRCDVVIFREDCIVTSCHRLVALSESCLAWEGGCFLCSYGHPNAAADLSQTRLFHAITLNGVLGIVSQLAISAITGYCFRIHSRFSSYFLRHQNRSSRLGLGLGRWRCRTVNVIGEMGSGLLW